jgi:ribosome-associated protein
MIDYQKIESEIRLSAQRSRGPGGQHVNKTSSSAQLKWNYLESQALSEFNKRLIAEKLSNHINKIGEITLRSDSSRDLESNKKEVIQKLFDLIAKATKREKKRIATKPTYGSKIRKLDSKKKRSDLKKNRTKKWDY